jgi:Effector protein
MIRIPQWNITIAYALGPAARSSAAKVYEERVRIAVNAVMRSQCGKALLGTFRAPLYKDTSLWIMPFTGPAEVCNSQTGPFYSADPETGKKWTYEGARIQYSPDRWAMDQCGWYPGQRAEEVLFHEMVHASRNMNNPAYDSTDLGLMGDYEEFLAVLITNMFRTELGATKIHRDYIYKLLVDQREAELFLSSRRAYIAALKTLLDDSLVTAVTGIDTPFNPFRDFARLEADHSDIRELMDDINPFVQLREDERLKAIGKKLEEQRDMSIDSSAKVIHHR